MEELKGWLINKNENNQTEIQKMKDIIIKNQNLISV